MAHSLFVLLFIFGAIIPTFDAHIGHFDEVWRRRAEEAIKFADLTYESEPINVTLAFNKKTREYVKSPLSLARARTFSILMLVMNMFSMSFNLWSLRD